LIKGVWQAIRAAVRRNHAALSLAGPVAFLTVIAAWGALVTLGFALILWPHFPEGFSAGGEELTDGGFADALYLSLVDLTSLGYGDIVPTGDLLRFLGPLETLIGLGLLTASISWILFLYRVLSDHRALSHEISLLSDAEQRSGIALDEIEPAAAAEVLSDLTSRVLAVRDDLVHSPIAYYFHPREARNALPVLLPRLVEVVGRCSQPQQAASLRFQAQMLRQAAARSRRPGRPRIAGMPAARPSPPGSR
jgi:hypothetical protein